MRRAQPGSGWPGCCIWGQIVAVTVPSADQEAARDPVRARADCRGDLMSARHRVSKLPLGQGIIYSGGRTRTGEHEAWLRAQRFEAAPLRLAYAPPWTRCRPPLIAATASIPRSPNWPPTVPTRRWSTRLGCLRGVSTSTAFGVAVEIGDWGQQPAPAPPLSVVRYPQEAPSGRQHRRRPGTGRLALVGGPARHLSTGPYSHCPNNPGGGGSAWE